MTSGLKFLKLSPFMNYMIFYLRSAPLVFCSIILLTLPPLKFLNPSPSMILSIPPFLLQSLPLILLVLLLPLQPLGHTVPLILRLAPLLLPIKNLPRVIILLPPFSLLPLPLYRMFSILYLLGILTILFPLLFLPLLILLYLLLLLPLHAGLLLLLRHKLSPHDPNRMLNLKGHRPKLQQRALNPNNSPSKVLNLKHKYNEPNPNNKSLLGLVNLLLHSPLNNYHTFHTQLLPSLLLLFSLHQNHKLVLCLILLKPPVLQLLLIKTHQ